MTTDFVGTQLAAYVSLREALGFHMRAEKIILPDFVAFVKAHQNTGPIRAQMALEWACQSSAHRGPSGAARRLSMARGFLLYLQASAPDTEVPAPGLLPAPRRPKPYLFTPTQITALCEGLKRVVRMAPCAPTLYPVCSGCWRALVYGWAKPFAYRSMMSNLISIHRHYTSWRRSSVNPGLCHATPARQSASVTTISDEHSCTTMGYRRPFSCLNRDSTCSIVPCMTGSLGCASA
jgi:hypothetical protein